MPNAAGVDAGDHEVAILQLDDVLLRRRHDSLAPPQVDGAAAERQKAGCVRPGLSAIGADVLHTFTESLSMLPIFSMMIPVNSLSPFHRRYRAFGPRQEKLATPPKTSVSR